MMTMARSGSHEAINGEYKLLSLANANRPSYANSTDTLFLYYHATNSAWMINKKLGEPIAPAFVKSTVASPDLIQASRSSFCCTFM